MIEPPLVESDPPAKPSFRRALASRPFFLLWLSQLISQSGDFVFDIALIWLVLEVTGSVFAVGVVVAVAAIPQVVAGPIIGVYVDRWDRRSILIGTNVAEGLLVAVLSGLVLAHYDGLGLILVIVFALGCGAQFVRTSTNAMVPRVVRTEDLPPANSLMTFSSSTNQVLGLSIGGIVVALFGVAIPIEYDALSFFVAALIVLGIARAIGRAEAPADGAKTGFRAEFVEGLTFIRQHRFLLELIVLGIILNFFGNALTALFAPYAKITLSGTAATYGFLGAAIALGSILGAAIIGKVETRKSTGKYLFGGAFGIGVAFAIMGFTRSIPIALSEVFLLGTLLSITNIPLFVLIQAKVPHRLLGRVLAAFVGLITASGPLGAFSAGVLADRLTIAPVFVLSGIVILLTVGAAALTMKDLRRIEY
jgi:MFS transporter, DHA3 family, macrolide efflux protein